MEKVKFTVDGKGEFPFDMLRYDACYPATTWDAQELKETFRRRIMLVSDAAPHKGRWESFGWEVVEVT